MARETWQYVGSRKSPIYEGIGAGTKRKVPSNIAPLSGDRNLQLCAGRETHKQMTYPVILIGLACLDGRTFPSLVRHPTGKHHGLTFKRYHIESCLFSSASVAQRACLIHVSGIPCCHLIYIPRDPIMRTHSDLIDVLDQSKIPQLRVKKIARLDKSNEEHVGRRHKQKSLNGIDLFHCTPVIDSSCIATAYMPHFSSGK